MPSINFAEMPKKFSFSFWAKSKRRWARGKTGEPSKKTIVTPRIKAHKEPIPHHPTAGSEEKDLFFRLHIKLVNPLVHQL
jgi:hypothetical protein